MHAFAPNSHQNGKLLSQTSCKEVCRSVEMIYSAFMLSPDMGGPRYGLILLFWRDWGFYLSNHAKEMLPNFSVTLSGFGKMVSVKLIRRDR